MGTTGKGFAVICKSQTIPSPPWNTSMQSSSKCIFAIWSLMPLLVPAWTSVCYPHVKSYFAFSLFLNKMGFLVSLETVTVISLMQGITCHIAITTRDFKKRFLSILVTHFHEYINHYVSVISLELYFQCCPLYSWQMTYLQHYKRCPKLTFLHCLHLLAIDQSILTII